MHRFLILGAVGLAVGGLGVTRFASMEERLAQLDEFRRTTPRVVADLRSGFSDIDSRMDELLGALDELQIGSQQDEIAGHALQEELSTLSGALLTARTELEKQRSSLIDLEARQAQWTDQRSSSETMGTRFEELEAGVQALEAGVDHRYEALTDVVRSAVTLAEDARTEIEALRNAQNRGIDGLWADTMGPTVQLAGSSTVGSGVLLPSCAKEGGGYETLLLTSWHVVRDIRAEDREDRPIPVTVYERGGVLRREKATLLRYDADIDVALLRLESNRPMPAGARLASRERLRDMCVFDEVVAVGCPLGNDPIPTRGEVAELDHRVDGNSYWMISAPTYIGNSGGGIFDAETHELIGIFSKIYTHGSLRPTVVPHMGLITPLEQVYDWLEGEGVAKVGSEENATGSGATTRLVLNASH